MQRTEAERMLWLARVMLTGNAAQDAHFQGRATDMACVPPHKQLANAPPETGLPICNLASHWRYFRRRYPGHLLLLHVGQCLEVCGAQGGGLWLPAGGAPVERPGLGAGLAWPVARGAVLRRALRRRGQPFCQIVEDGYLRGGMKQRSLRWVFSPPGSGAARDTTSASPAISPIFESSRGE